MKRKLVLGLLCAAVLSAAVVAGGVSYVRHRVSAARLHTTGGLLVDRAMLIVHWQNLEPEEAFLAVIRKLDEGLTKQRFGLRFISPDKDLEKEQPKNEFERQLLDRFAERTPDEVARLDRPEYVEGPVTENNEYRYFRAIRAKRECFAVCHCPPVANGMNVAPEPPATGREAPGGQKWKEGDLMAIVEITIPLPLNEP